MVRGTNTHHLITCFAPPLQRHEHVYAHSERRGSNAVWRRRGARPQRHWASAGDTCPPGHRRPLPWCRPASQQVRGMSAGVCCTVCVMYASHARDLDVWSKLVWGVPSHCCPCTSSAAAAAASMSPAPCASLSTTRPQQPLRRPRRRRPWMESVRSLLLLLLRLLVPALRPPR